MIGCADRSGDRKGDMEIVSDCGDTVLGFITAHSTRFHNCRIAGSFIIICRTATSFITVGQQ